MSLQHVVSDERYLSRGCFDFTSFRSTRRTRAHYCLFALRSSTTPRSGISSDLSDFILRSKISFAVRQISLRVLLLYAPGVGGRGSGAAGVFHKVLTLKTALFSHLQLYPPKLVHLKYTSPLQTVNLLHSGWRGVANKGTSPRACGWEAYLSLSPNRRSGARHQPLATERRKRQGCGVVYLHNAPICTLAIPTSIASGTYRHLVLHLQPDRKSVV